MKFIVAIIDYLLNLLTSDCPKCGSKRVKYIGDDFTGRIWIAVYECENCNTQFV